jgi:glutamate/tyrosine decarboxylase-like PLP-dependent enzyme
MYSLILMDNIAWSGGIYASPSLAGSRPGALIAGCWAALMKMGNRGYEESAKKIVAAAQTIRKGCVSFYEYRHGMTLIFFDDFSISC